MKKHKDAFMKLFEQFKKDDCVRFALNGLNNNDFSIPELYENILGPALYAIDECDNNDNDCIWREHVKTAIVRTIIESIYPYVIEKKRNIASLNHKVVLVCPEKEYHEIGLRMMSDFFDLNGYESVFIGSNTPRDQVCVAISQNNPKYVAIGITDFYLMFEAKKLIARIRSQHSDRIKIILGGTAFHKNPSAVSEIGGDLYLASYNDIKNLAKEDSTHETSI
ncbi:MAG TPA: cobalamin-binding protein [Clostridiales bacterium]|nr:cobalamin-binding protein [Clostridiales bacterium]